MIGLQSPAWLSLLVLLPAVYWLYRYRRAAADFPSTTWFLLQRIASRQPGGRPAKKPDPSWISSAAIVTLLVIALAGPRVPGPGHPVTEVWLDDSLSMFAREGERTRLALALDELQRDLEQRSSGQLRIHSLGSGGAPLLIESPDPAQLAAQIMAWLSGPAGEPAPPPAATLASRHRHLLLTDGADDGLNRWARGAPLDGIIRVGASTRNLVLSRLALRRALDAPGRFDGMVQVDNLGDRPETVRLTLQLGRQALEQRSLEIAAGASVQSAFGLDATSPAMLRARIDSGADALAEDDELVLGPAERGSWRYYRKTGQCGPYIAALLDSRPEYVEDPGRAGFAIDCAAGPAPGELPTLKIHRTGVIGITRQAAHRHGPAAAVRVALAAGIPYSGAAPRLATDVTPLLSADGRILVSRARRNPALIELYVDVADAGFARRRDFPLIMLGLLHELTEHGGPYDPLIAQRNIDASRIIPAQLAPREDSGEPASRADISLAPWLLAAALLLLLVTRFFPGAKPPRIGAASR